jgi:hypothetical protein
MSEAEFSGKLTMLAGAGLAFYMSFTHWHSYFWAIIDSIFLGWIYVVYSAIRYGIHI